MGEGAPIPRTLILLRDTEQAPVIYLMENVPPSMLCDLLTHVDVRTLVALIQEVSAATIAELLNVAPSSDVCELLNRSPVGVSVLALSMPVAMNTQLLTSVPAPLLASMLEALPDVSHGRRQEILQGPLYSGVQCCSSGSVRASVVVDELTIPKVEESAGPRPRRAGAIRLKSPQPEHLPPGPLPTS